MLYEVITTWVSDGIPITDATKLTAENPITEEFGDTVAISGNTVMVGAPVNDYYNDDDTVDTSGHVYIFE